jgi:hypothetical protein
LKPSATKTNIGKDIWEKKNMGPCHFWSLTGHIMHHYHELT